ncbi:FAD-dependent monooxygenase [Mesobacillus jeotgali]|uniref:FAD-dependent monooxygenase n=1 Tax=Mesobacillus jeotgali TaxID=129985 RepID=A0ABY9VL57_9BACI|nr:FAD-dependent monooxygenase [Mesobacillus jeotgali]WNF24679.1 FAD-dependent monooxygenase [Mesobacillus jeotgali]
MVKTLDNTDTAIIGAGIGGLSAAIALQQIGQKVKVYERASELKEMGAGIVLSANAIKALEKLGVADQVRQAGSPVKKAEIRTPDGKLLVNMPVHKQAERYGTYSYLIYRPYLQRILYEKLEPDTVKHDKKFIVLEQDSEYITSMFEDGEALKSKIVIGADGVHSRVRQNIFEDTPLRYSGFTAFRGITCFEDNRFPAELGGGFEAWGKGKRFGFSHLGKGRVFWFAAINAPQGTLLAAKNKKQVVLENFKSWWGQIPDVIESTDEENILVHEIFDRKTIKKWHKGRVTLLGDAAHPMLPNLGQGGAQAMEDALMLARYLKRFPQDVEKALSHYEQVRIPRVDEIVGGSRMMARMMQLENPLAIKARNQLLRKMPDELKIKRLDWILGYEV